MYACLSSSEDHKLIASYLLRQPTINVNYIAKSTGDNALMCAVVGGNEFAVAELVKNKADLNHKNKLGYTALMKACEIGSYNIVKILVDADAKKWIVNDSEVWLGKAMNAMKFALLHGHIHVASSFFMCDFSPNIHHEHRVPGMFHKNHDKRVLSSMI